MPKAAQPDGRVCETAKVNGSCFAFSARASVLHYLRFVIQCHLNALLSFANFFAIDMQTPDLTGVYTPSTDPYFYWHVAGFSRRRFRWPAVDGDPLLVAMRRHYPVLRMMLRARSLIAKERRGFVLRDGFRARLDSTLRCLVEDKYSYLKVRKGALQAAVLDIKLQDAFLGRADFLNELSLIPNVGAKTVETLSQVIEVEAVELMEEVRARGESGDLSGDLLTAIKDIANMQRDGAEGGVSSFNGSFISGGMEGNNNHPFWLLMKAKGRSVYYLPMSIPDILKTKAVWAAERGGGSVSRAYEGKINLAYDIAKKSNVKVEFLIDSPVWSRILERRDEYAALSDLEVNEQMNVLKIAMSEFPGRMAFSTVNFRAEGLTNCLIAENEFVSSYVFGGFMVSRDLSFVNYIYRKIRWANKAKIAF